jgi:L-histidine Nalpha-methyltransferase
MTQIPASAFGYTDLLPASYFQAALRSDIRKGLGLRQKRTSPVWFYDETGSALYEQICELPEYYQYRTEHAILSQYAGAIADRTRARTLVELGSGASTKTKVLLNALTLDRYVPIDVSESALRVASSQIAGEYPRLTVQALRADFNDAFTLPEVHGSKIIVFMGSTIGNYRHSARARFLHRLRQAMGPDDALLLGADLIKPVTELLPAYDDSAGVSAQFSKNLLQVLNRELQADFDPDSFEHVASWDSSEQCIEMRLRSTRDQVVSIPALGLRVAFQQGEDWITETSAKFSPQQLRTELAAADLAVTESWTDRAARFSVSLALPL